MGLFLQATISGETPVDNKPFKRRKGTSVKVSCNKRRGATTGNSAEMLIDPDTHSIAGLAHIVLVARTAKEDINAVGRVTSVVA